MLLTMNVVMNGVGSYGLKGIIKVITEPNETHTRIFNNIDARLMLLLVVLAYVCLM